MTAGGLLGVIQRQRRLLVAVLLAASAAGVVAALLAPARYDSSAVLTVRSPVLVGPVVQRPYEGMHLTNPLIRDDSGLNSVAKLLIESAGADKTSRNGTAVTVSDGREDPSGTAVSPVLVVTAEGVEPRNTRIDASTEIDRLTAALRRIQMETNVPATTFMSLETVVAPVDGVRQRLVAARTGLVVLAGIATAGVLMVFIRDGARS